MIEVVNNNGKGYEQTPSGLFKKLKDSSFFSNLGIDSINNFNDYKKFTKGFLENEGISNILGDSLIKNDKNIQESLKKTADKKYNGDISKIKFGDFNEGSYERNGLEFAFMKNKDLFVNLYKKKENLISYSDLPADKKSFLIGNLGTENLEYIKKKNISFPNNIDDLDNVSLLKRTNSVINTMKENENINEDLVGLSSFLILNDKITKFEQIISQPGNENIKQIYSNEQQQNLKRKNVIISTLKGKNINDLKDVVSSIKSKKTEDFTEVDNIILNLYNQFTKFDSDGNEDLSDFYKFINGDSFDKNIDTYLNAYSLNSTIELISLDPINDKNKILSKGYSVNMVQNARKELKSNTKLQVFLSDYSDFLGNNNINLGKKFLNGFNSLLSKNIIDLNNMNIGKKNISDLNADVFTDDEDFSSFSMKNLDNNINNKVLGINSNIEKTFSNFNNKESKINEIENLTNNKIKKKFINNCLGYLKNIFNINIDDNTNALQEFNIDNVDFSGDNNQEKNINLIGTFNGTKININYDIINGEVKVNKKINVDKTNNNIDIKNENKFETIITGGPSVKSFGEKVRNLNSENLINGITEDNYKTKYKNNLDIELTKIKNNSLKGYEKTFIANHLLEEKVSDSFLNFIGINSKNEINPQNKNFNMINSFFNTIDTSNFKELNKLNNSFSILNRMKITASDYEFDKNKNGEIQPTPRNIINYYLKNQENYNLNGNINGNIINIFKLFPLNNVNTSDRYEKKFNLDLFCKTVDIGSSKTLNSSKQFDYFNKYIKNYSNIDKQKTILAFNEFSDNYFPKPNTNFG